MMQNHLNEYYEFHMWCFCFEVGTPTFVNVKYVINFQNFLICQKMQCTYSGVKFLTVPGLLDIISNVVYGNNINKKNTMRKSHNNISVNIIWKVSTLNNCKKYFVMRVVQQIINATKYLLTCVSSTSIYVGVWRCLLISNDILTFKVTVIKIVSMLHV